MVFDLLSGFRNRFQRIFWIFLLLYFYIKWFIKHPVIDYLLKKMKKMVQKIYLKTIKNEINEKVGLFFNHFSNYIRLILLMKVIRSA